MWLALLGLPAMAAGYGTDIELVRPTFSEGSIPGIDSPTLGEPGTVRVGTLAQFTRDPLVLFEEGFESGAVVARRVGLQTGVSVVATPALGLRLVVPAAVQWGSEVQDLAADGVGLGDMGFGARVQVLQFERVTAGLRGDVMLPTGRADAYLGEAGLRAAFGGLAAIDAGPVEILADAGVIGRQEVVTEEDFVLGTELALDAGVRYPVWPDRMALTAGFVSRGGVSNLFQGGAENASELFGGLQIQPSRSLQVDLGLGRGLAPGYGTSEFRAMSGLTWSRAPAPPPPPEPEPVAVIEEIMPEPEPDPPPDPEPDPPEELARIERDQIVIRDPIQFEVGTWNILPESRPVLRAVAGLMQENGEVGFVIIEGHASEEGSYEYNYELSTNRARSIYEALVEAGVHPARLGFRGMGEVVPVAVEAGEDGGEPGGEGDPEANPDSAEEQELAANRRVNFHIVHQMQPGDEPLDLTPEVPLPWTGEPATFTTPVPPEPPPPPEPTFEPGDRFNPDEFLDFDDEEPFFGEDPEDEGEDEDTEDPPEAP